MPGTDFVVGFVALCFVCFVAGAYVASAYWLRRYTELERSFVQVGDLWRYVGPGSSARSRIYEAVRTRWKNGIVWEMRGDAGEILHLTLPAVEAGEWVLCMRNGVPKQRDWEVKLGH